MRKKIYTGYAVVSRDILDDTVYKKGRFGISLHDRTLDTCNGPMHTIYTQITQSNNSFSAII